MEDIVLQVKKILEDNASPELSRPFFDGDPIFVSKSHLPTIAVTLSKDNITAGATGYDRHIYTLIIKVIVNKENDFNKEPSMVVAHRTLRNFTEGINGAIIDEQSIVGILRKNFTLNGSISNQTIVVDYNTINREDVVTEEAWITITIEKNIEVSGRN